MKTHPRMLLLTTALVGLATLSIVGCNKSPETAGPAAPRTSVGTEIDDSVVTASVKSALLGDPDIKSFDLKVETRKGEVQLSGFVDSQAQVDRATALANGVNGVKAVQNSVTLKGSATTVGNTIDDSIISTRAKAALLNDSSVKSFDIAVVTRKGEVQLSGFVDNQTQIDQAIHIVSGIEGVHGVINEMSIKK